MKARDNSTSTAKEEEVDIQENGLSGPVAYRTVQQYRAMPLLPACNRRHADTGPGELGRHSRSDGIVSFGFLLTAASFLLLCSVFDSSFLVS